MVPVFKLPMGEVNFKRLKFYVGVGLAQSRFDLGKKNLIYGY